MITCSVVTFVFFCFCFSFSFQCVFMKIPSTFFSHHHHHHHIELVCEPYIFFKFFLIQKHRISLSSESFVAFHLFFFSVQIIKRVFQLVYLWMYGITNICCDRISVTKIYITYECVRDLRIEEEDYMKMVEKSTNNGFHSRSKKEIRNNLCSRKRKMRCRFFAKRT